MTHATDYAKGRLPWPTRIQMWLHLAMCASCRRDLHQMDVTRSLLGRVGRDTEPHEIPLAVREAFRNRRAEWDHIVFLSPTRPVQRPRRFPRRWV